jgi:hypothetical protein
MLQSQLIEDLDHVAHIWVVSQLRHEQIIYFTCYIGKGKPGWVACLR